MAVALTRNLKLRIDSNLTANSKYNLERIDLLGSTFLVDSTNTLNIRSQTDLTIEPNSADLGGSGVGGTVTIGTANHQIDTLMVNATNFVLSTALGLQDQAVSGTKDLYIQYKSDVNGSVDTSSNRTLSIDLDGADRNLVMGGSLSLLGGDLTLNLSGTTSLTLPQLGTLSTLDGSEVLTNKTISALSNSIVNLSNANLASNAAVSYSKLNLLGNILNSDISNSAAIQYSKLALSSQILNSDISASAGIAYSKLSLASSITNSDISPSAQIAYSKLLLSGSIVNADISSLASISRTKVASGTPGALVTNDASTGLLSETLILDPNRGGTGVTSSATFPTLGLVLTDSNTATLSNKSISGNNNTLSNIDYSSLSLSGSLVNSDISNSAAISYSKLSLSGSIVNSDIASGAAISGSKINPDFGNQTIKTLMGLEFSEGGYKTTLEAAQGGQAADLVFQLPYSYGTPGQVLSSDGSGSFQWITVGGTGTVTSVGLSAPAAEFTVSGSPVTTSGTLSLSKNNQAANTVWAGPVSGAAAQPGFRILDILDLPALTTDNVTEGSNLYYTDERVDDRVSALLQSGTGISLSYNDPANTLTVTNTAPDQTVTISSGAGISVTGTYPNFTVASSITQYTDEMAQDAVGTILTDTATIDFTYNDAGNTIIADLKNTTVTPGSYGSASSVPNYTVDATGRLTAAVSTSILIAESQVTNLVSDLASKVPTTRNVLTGIGLGGGGDLSADRTISLNNTAVTLGSYGTATQVSTFTVDQQGRLTAASNTSIQIAESQVTNLTTDLSGKASTALSNLTVSGLTAQDLLVASSSSAVTRLGVGSNGQVLTVVSGAVAWAPTSATVTPVKANWITADGTTKTITHNLNSGDLIVQIIDTTTGQYIEVDTKTQTSTNVLTLTASQAPASSWRVLILAI